MQIVEVLRKQLSGRDHRRARNLRQFATFDALEPRLLLSPVTMTDNEQLMLELVNRARANPTAEATRQGIGLNDGLPAGTISTAAKQPLAPHQSLITAAGLHAEDMLNRDYFDHTTQGTVNGPAERAQDAGYPSSSVGENIAWGGTTGVVDQVQAVFDRHRGLFLSTGHRTNMLHIPYEEIGAGVRYGQYTTGGTTYNATMVSISFGIRSVNPFITGVVYTDSDNDSFYDIGEAVRSGTVRATNLTTGAVFSESIGNSGGYGIIVPAGSYSVTATYTLAGVQRLSTKTVIVGTDNVKTDFDSTDPSSVTLTLASTVTALNETGPNATSTIQVTRDGDLGTSIVVSLSSNDTTEATVPLSVTIPAGQSSATFTVTAVNDTVIDGTQTARITGTAALYTAGSLSLTVADRNWPLLPSVVQIVTTPRPTFTWTSVSNAATYQIYANNVTTAQTGVINQSGITTTSLTSPIDLPIGNFNVWVRGFTAAGLASIWSPVSVWKVRPTTTVLNSGRTEASPSFTIEWAPIVGASSYDVWVDRLTSSTSQYLRDTSVLGSSLVVSNFAIGKYGVWVRARNTAGDLVNWSPQAIINVNVAPTGLNVTAPGLAGTPTLNWDAVGGASFFDVWVDNLTTGTPQVIRDTAVVGNSLALSTLTAGSYRVWVRAKDVNGAAYAWSGSFDFEVGRAPRLLTPIGNGQPARPLFTWTNVSGATRYELVIADAALVPIMTESNLTGTAFTPSVDLTTGAYRAWIRAFDGAGNSSVQSATISFTISAVERLPQRPSDEAELVLAFVSIDEWLTGSLSGGNRPARQADVVVADVPVADADVVIAANSGVAAIADRLQVKVSDDDDISLHEQLINVAMPQLGIASGRDDRGQRPVGA